MKKSKDGQIIASLTEVKNKTGDIFALADEFGEVLLTSYNKPRYKIVKIDISDVLDLKDEGPKKTNRPPLSESVKAVKEELNHNEAAKEGKKESNLLDRQFTITRWDRDGKNERSFVQKATKSLIS